MSDTCPLASEAIEEVIGVDLTSLEGDLLDSQTQKTLETSMVMQILKLFAIMTKVDEVVTQAERDFVARYCEQLYPPIISRYLYQQFENYLISSLDFEKVVGTINERLSYQEKVFCLMKTYELMVTDEAEESEIILIHKIARMLQVSSEDVAFIEYIFGLQQGTAQLLTESAIVQILISGDKATGDVYIPYPELHLEIFKVYNLFCFIQRGTSRLLVDGHRVHPNVFARIPHNADVLVNDYTIKYQDLKIYSENVVNPLHADLFLTGCGETLTWQETRDRESSLHLRMEGSYMILTPISRQLHCVVNSEVIPSGTPVHVNLNDVILINNERLNIREISFRLNRERVIRLPRSQDQYEISNDPRADVFIADDLPEKWNALVLRNEESFHLKRGNCPYQMRINGKALRNDQDIEDDDTFFVNNRFLRFHFESSRVTQTLFSFEKLVADTIEFAFDDGTCGLREVSFEIHYGDLVSILGPSGCGKSTLLNLISGFTSPKNGSIFLGEHNLHRDFSEVKDFLGYVPQDDLLIANLTVYENLFYNAKLRFPDRSRQEIDAQVEIVLRDIGLLDKKHTKVGSPLDKRLSGGERKRLNIGLELMANAEVYLLDEPTSGLSSKDSENIIELLANIASRGKIVLAVIHQPSSKLYKMFNKVLLLDKGGNLAYFGTTYSALSYFQEHRDNGLSLNQAFSVECPCCKSVQPDLLLDTLEESLRDVDGTRLTERKFSPEYWKLQFQEYRKGAEEIEAALPELKDLPASQVLTLKDRINQFLTLLSRTFRTKMRDRTNLIITFLGAPVLGLLVGLVTKFAPNDHYSLMDNNLYETFLFTAVIVAMFFGMTNSVDDIIRDRAILLRERMLSLQNRSYLAAKLIVLFGFAVLQNMMYLGLGFLVLEVRELFLAHLAYLSLVSLGGIALGLCISAVPHISSKAAQNFIPLLLIPQIILGGSLVTFDKMNRELRFYKESPIPEICQVMPSRWAFEGMMVLHAQYNSFDTMYNLMGDQINDLKRERPILKKKKEEIIKNQGIDFYAEEMGRLQSRIEALQIERERFLAENGVKYGNNEIHQKVALADATFGKNPTAVYRMLVSQKHVPFTDLKISTVYYNAGIILALTVLLLSATLLMLRYNEKMYRAMNSIRRQWQKTNQTMASRFKFQQD